MAFNTKDVSYAGVICFAVALRSMVSLYSYSGEATPPLYGDYEAQRHWQEICVNIKPSNWYTNSSDNDLLYWGLDYPPLTGYHSFVLGKVAQQLNPSYVELYSSRGYESADHKWFMRLSVLAADLFLYIPALLLAVLTVDSLRTRKGATNLKLQHLAVCLFYPGQILIDNGHFQYNNISLALATLAIIGIVRDNYIFASICFSLALNYKQMELYHAVPFFVYLLQVCFRERKIQSKFLKLAKIGASVIFTFAILWLPWICTWERFISVVKRIFPINRGVFEDKVSNIWCAANVLIKLKTLFNNESMALICLAATSLALLPSAIHLFRKTSKHAFLYSLFNSALTFFLFSFQVHEKSILLPALPAMLLYPFEPFVVMWFLQISTLSMFPLLAKDKLVLPFIALSVIFQAFLSLVSDFEPMTKDPMYRKYKWIYRSSCIMGIALALCLLHAPVPTSLPHLYILVISVFSCAHFVMFLCYTNYKQFVHKSVSILKCD